MDLEKRYSRLPDRDYPNFRVMFDSICLEYETLPAARIRLEGDASYTEWTYADLRREIGRAHV